MQLESRHFGTLEYGPEAILEVAGGLPAFEDETRFVLIEQAAVAPLVILQSLQTPELAFLTLPVLAVAPDYRLQMSAEDLQRLDLEAGRQPEIGQEVLCLAIVTLSPDGPPTANLMAPVVVNRRTRQALQAIQADSGYSHQHALRASREADGC